MSYYISKKITANTLSEAIEKTTAALKEEGFGIITTIDMQATLKNKLGAEIEPYTILGACNPKFAHEAMQAEENIGVFLPCNVLVKKAASGFEAVAVDPVASMIAVPNKALHAYAEEVKNLLKSALERL